MTPSIQSLTRAVAQHLGISPQYVRSSLRHPTLVLARHVVMYVARAELGLTYDEIGRGMGRHNTSVLHGISRIADLIHAGDERVLAAVRTGELAAVPWRKQTRRDALRERREQLIELAREWLAEADRIGRELGERAVAAE